MRNAARAVAGPLEERPTSVDPVLLAGVAGLGLLSLALLVIGDGNLGLGLAPLAIALVVLAIIKIPLRYSMLAIGFLCLTLENPNEAFAANRWHSPLAVLGALLLAHLNVTIPVKALFFSGLDLVLLFFACVWAIRRMTGSQVDVCGHVPPAQPVRQAGLISLAAVFLFWGFGMLQGGFSFGDSLWQLFRLVYLPCVFLLFCACLRGPEDARPLGIALLLAALFRACVAIYVRSLFPSTEILPHATTHADSMLFADAFTLILVIFFERPTLRNLGLAAATLPILSWGLIANNRRLGWVELGICLLVLYLFTPMTRLKRRIAQGVVLSIPLAVIYIGIGWSHPTGVFAPVQTIRSVVDSQSDTSTLWRDLENYDLYSTLRTNPVLGTGLGHAYIETIQLPDISEGYSLYRYAPHNSILGLFAYTGLLGFAAIWMILPLGIFFAVRSYRFSTQPRDRTAALTSVGVLVAYMVHCYGDMGLGTFTSVFTVGAALALMAKQAVATGAWPMRPRSGADQPTKSGESELSSTVA